MSVLRDGCTQLVGPDGLDAALKRFRRRIDPVLADLRLRNENATRRARRRAKERRADRRRQRNDRRDAGLTNI